MLVGNSDVWAALSTHLRAACGAGKTRMDEQSVVLVTGPTGCGKSMGIHHLLGELGCHVTELDCWNAREMKDGIVAACKCPLLATLQNRLDQPRIILIDSAEVLVEFDPSVPAALHILVKSKGLPHVTILCVVNDCAAARFKKFPNRFAMQALTQEDVAALLIDGMRLGPTCESRAPRRPVRPDRACVEDMFRCKGHASLADDYGELLGQSHPSNSFSFA